jgi:4-hydroxythreonine-4-phosphate dehydrogenase
MSAPLTLGVTTGDPLGVGPEVTLKALADPAVARAARWRVYGTRPVLGEAAAAWPDARAAPDAPIAMVEPTGGVALSFAGVEGVADGLEGSGSPMPRRPTAAAGAVSFALVDHAIADALRGASDPARIAGIVTAPISKEAWNVAGHDFPGHTELLADRCARAGASARAVMMFISDTLRVALVTTHIPVRDVPGAIATDGVVETILLAAEACRRVGIDEPRIAVCGLNPHAGEGGMLGGEDNDVIRPAIERACAAGLRASGPHPGDTIFRAAIRGDYELVIAMYHDQGLIPVKLLAFESAVNVTLGLPIVRTSPDHGTAWDIAGRGIADPGSMIAACLLAAKLAG